MLRSGGGRLIAADLKPDLRRTYKKTEKHGSINPLIYSIVVCPNCLYSAMSDDFLMIKDDTAQKIKSAASKRKKYGEMIFGPADFMKDRDIMLGAASYFFAVDSYSFFPNDFAPTCKKAICALRASWLLSDLHTDNPGKGWDELYLRFRYVAWTGYERSITYAETGEETFDNLKKFGPDIDMDYGFDGALYMMAYLGAEHRSYIPAEKQYQKFKYYRTALAKVFGFGKSSKLKPSPLLNTAKDLHQKLGAVLKEIDQGPIDD